MHYSYSHGAYVLDWGDFFFFSNWLMLCRNEIGVWEPRGVAVEQNGVQCRETDTASLQRTTEICNTDVVTVWRCLALVSEMLYWALIRAIQLHGDFSPWRGFSLALQTGKWIACLSETDIFSGTPKLGMAELASAGWRT